MSVSYLENRVSALVKSQLPEHVRSEYENFVFFLEAYYEYLEQNRYPQEIIQNIKNYADIDETIDDFIIYFYKNYCADFPTNPDADKKLTLKHINELYAKKGSEKAIRLLFRLLFNNDVSFYYPEIQVFKASGGRWSDKLSIKVSGSWDRIKNLIGYRITGAVSGASAKVVNAEYQTGTNIIELFLDRKTINGVFVPNEAVSGQLPGQSNDLFIVRTYNAFLGRDPSTPESLDFLEQLELGTYTPKDIIQLIAQSEECEYSLPNNLDFMKVLTLQATGYRLLDSDYVGNYGPRLNNGESRSTIIAEILASKTSQEYLLNVLRLNDTITITASVRPVVSNVTIVNAGYNYNVGDIVTIDNDITGNNGLRGRVAEINYVSKPNYDSNIANATFLTHGIVKIDLDNFDTVNVTYANANLILRVDNLSKANVIQRALWQNNMPALFSNIDAGNTSFSYGQSANLQAHIGAMCEYSGFWRRDRKSQVQEGVISLPENQFGGMVFRGRRDDGSFDDDIRNFVADVYFNLLDRTPDTTEYVECKSIINKGDIANFSALFSEVILKVIKTEEFRTSDKFSSAYKFIEILYKLCLNRAVDTEGQRFWFSIIRAESFSDAVKYQVATDISTSLEAQENFRAKYNPQVLISDHVYYQPFSYEIQTSENISVWREIVNKLVHPAGLVFFGRTKISQPATKPETPPGRVEPKVRGIGSIRGIYNYLNVAIRVLKSLPPLYGTPQDSFIVKERRIFSSVTQANANTSYVGFGPRYETIDRWKFSYSANVDGGDTMYAQVLANISLDKFDAENIKGKYDISPPLYRSIINTSPWSFNIVPSANVIEEGRVVTFNIYSANVPDGTEIVYVIEQGSSRANNEPRGDISWLLDGMTVNDPAANAAYLNYQNPSLPSDSYYINWSNTIGLKNSVLAYCEMDGAAVNSNANGWIRLDTDLLSIYDEPLNVNLINMRREETNYLANTVDGIRLMSIPLPRNTRGIRIEYINLENINLAEGTVNRLDLADVYNSSQGQTINVGSNFDHFGVSVHALNNTSNVYLSNVSLENIQNTDQAVNFFGNDGGVNKRANANVSYFTQTDDVGFNIDRLIISQSEGAGETINIRDLKIWIR